MGTNGLYADDLLRAGTKESRTECEKSHQRFGTSGDESLPFTFAAFTLPKQGNDFLARTSHSI